MQRTVVKTTLHNSQATTDLAYWLAQPVQVRIDAVEALRAQHIQSQQDGVMRVRKTCRVISLHQFNQSKHS